MKLWTMMIASVATAGLLSTGSAAQRQGQAPPEPGRGRGAAPPEFAGPPQGPGDLPIVETIGCLAEGPNATWMVGSATEPVKTPPGFSKPDEVKAAGTKALGTLRFRLVGLVELDPAKFKGHKVVVKGLLIKDAGETRLNVTSLMSASPSCAK